MAGIVDITRGHLHTVAGIGPEGQELLDRAFATGVLDIQPIGSVNTIETNACRLLPDREKAAIDGPIHPEHFAPLCNLAGIAAVDIHHKYLGGIPLSAQPDNTAAIWRKLCLLIFFGAVGEVDLVSGCEIQKVNITPTFIDDLIPKR